MNNQERRQMNPFLNILGPLLPTLAPNNRERFWTNHSREFDRIGWSGKYLFSASEDSEEEEEMLDSLVGQEGDEGYHNTSGCWDDGDGSEDSEVDESEREFGKVDDDDDGDDDASGSSQPLDNPEPSNRQSEQQTEDYHPNTSLEYYWDDIDSSESESADWDYDDDDDEEDYWYDVEQALIQWVVALLFVVGVWFVMWLLT